MLSSGQKQKQTGKQHASFSEKTRERRSSKDVGEG